MKTQNEVFYAKHKTIEVGVVAAVRNHISNAAFIRIDTLLSVLNNLGSRKSSEDFSIASLYFILDSMVESHSIEDWPSGSSRFPNVRHFRIFSKMFHAGISMVAIRRSFFSESLFWEEDIYTAIFISLRDEMEEYESKLRESTAKEKSESKKRSESDAFAVSLLEAIKSHAIYDSATDSIYLCLTNIDRAVASKLCSELSANKSHLDLANAEQENLFDQVKAAEKIIEGLK